MFGVPIVLDLLAAGRADAPALVSARGERWTYRQLRLARARTERSLRGGARGRLLVFLSTDRHPGGVVLYLASLFGGHVAGWLPDSTSASQLDALLARYLPDRLVLTREQSGVWAAVLASAGYTQQPGYTQQQGEDLGVLVAARRGTGAGEIPGDLALLLRTSGVTGAPKLVQLSGAGLAANTEAIRVALALSPRSRGVTSLPLHYTYGLSVLHSHLWAGGSVLVTDLPLTGRSFWRALHTHGCDSLPGVPQSFEWLRRAMHRTPALPLPATMTVSGGAMRRDTVLAMARACDIRGGGLYLMYGQTEATARITVLPPEECRSRPGSVGRPIGDWTISIMGEGSDPTPPSATGRVVLTGSAVMLGYASSRAELEAVTRPLEPLDTGDDGYLHDGCLYLTGRRTRMIKPGGVRLALDDIEHELAELANVAVIGLPGETARAYYESDPEEHHELPELSRRWRALAETLRVPAATLELRPVPTLPTTDRGKIDYAALTAPAGVGTPDGPR
jgi:acyl-CoA synthetase (AMP-forming)/AMP-acid ligase II